MFLILKQTIFDLITPRYFPIYDSPKKYPTILYAVNLWLNPVSATGASQSSVRNKGNMRCDIGGAENNESVNLSRTLEK